MGVRRSSSTCRRVPARRVRARGCKPESLSVTIGSRNIVQVGDFSIVNALRYFEALTADASESDGAYGTNGTNGNGERHELAMAATARRTGG